VWPERKSGGPKRTSKGKAKGCEAVEGATQTLFRGPEGLQGGGGTQKKPIRRECQKAGRESF